MAWNRTSGAWILMGIITSPYTIASHMVVSFWNGLRRKNVRNDERLDRLAKVKESGTQYYPAIEKIEEQTSHAVSIATNTTNQNLDKCSSQEQSILFQLPGEIREMIFTFVLVPVPAPIHLGNLQSCMLKQRCSTSLLLTCRRVWLEANSLALMQAELEFRLCVPPINSGAFSNPSNVQSTVLDRLTPKNREHLRYIRVRVDLWVTTKHSCSLAGILGRYKWPPNVTMYFRPLAMLQVWSTDGRVLYRVLNEAFMEWLKHASLAGVRHFRLVMETAEKHADNVRTEIIRAMVTDKLGRKNEFGWVLERTQLEDEMNYIEDRQALIGLEWRYVGDGPGEHHGTLPSPAKIERGLRPFFPHLVKELKGQRAMTRYRDQWQEQDSLLQFGERLPSAFNKDGFTGWPWCNI